MRFYTVIITALALVYGIPTSETMAQGQEGTTWTTEHRFAVGVSGMLAIPDPNGGVGLGTSLIYKKEGAQIGPYVGVSIMAHGLDGYLWDEGTDLSANLSLGLTVYPLDQFSDGRTFPISIFATGSIIRDQVDVAGLGGLHCEGIEGLLGCNEEYGFDYGGGFEVGLRWITAGTTYTTQSRWSAAIGFRRWF